MTPRCSSSSARAGASALTAAASAERWARCLPGTAPRRHVGFGHLAGGQKESLTVGMGERIVPGMFHLGASGGADERISIVLGALRARPEVFVMEKNPHVH